MIKFIGHFFIKIWTEYYKVLQKGTLILTLIVDNAILITIWRSSIMSRKARIKSPIGYYYISLKLNKDVHMIKESAISFLECLTFYKGYGVLAYAIEVNNISFIIHEKELSLHIIMCKVLRKFSHIFHQNNQSIDNIFRDRFYSEPLESVEHVFACIGRVHNSYSYQTLLNSKTDYFHDPYIDLTFYEMSSMEQEAFLLSTKSSKKEIKITSKLTDDELKRLLESTYDMPIVEMVKLPRSKLIIIIEEFMKISKVSARQLGRVTTLPLRMLWDIARRITAHQMNVANKED